MTKTTLTTGCVIVDRCQLRAAFESRNGDSGDGSRDSDRNQTRTVAESTITDRGDGVTGSFISHTCWNINGTRVFSRTIGDGKGFTTIILFIVDSVNFKKVVVDIFTRLRYLGFHYN